MKQKIFLSRWICLAAGSSFLFSSCWPGSEITNPYIVPENRQKENVYYIPSSPNTPLLTEKNDISFSAMSLANSKNSGAELQAAFMPGKKIGIMASYYGDIGHFEDVNFNRFEAGAGYVKKYSKTLHFETYAGLGKGKLLNYHYTGKSTLNLTHFFIQPAIAFSNAKKTVLFSFSSRFEGVNFKVNDTTFNNDREPFSTRQIKSLYDQPFHIMWQPGVALRLGWKNILFHSGYSYAADLTNTNLHRVNDNFSLGVTFRMNTSKRNVVNLDKQTTVVH